MVLDLSPPSESYDAPLDTPDPYSSTQPTSPSSAIAPSSLLPELESSSIPRPLPVFGPLFGFSPIRTATIASTRLSLVHHLLGRAANPDERAAILYHEAKAIRYVSYGLPIATLWGFYSAYNNRQTYRWPFYGTLKTENGWWDGERIRFRGATVFSGDKARLLVHGLRGTAYGGLAYLVGGMTAASFATTVANVGELTDPRLREFQNAVVQRRKTERERSAKPMGQVQGRDVTGQGEKSAVELWTKHRKGIGANDVDDDASPSAGSDGFMSGGNERLGGSANTDFLDDAQMQTPETGQQVEPRNSPTDNRSSTFQRDKVANQPSGFDDSFSGLDDDSSGAIPGGNQRGGSAWDRIRQKAHSSPQGTSSQSNGQKSSWNTVQKEVQSSGQQTRSWNEIQKDGRREGGRWEDRRRGDAAGDGFSFSSRDEERQLAKEEAQEAFDRRVERERQGGSFDEGRRW